jgi:hypothetical protein
MIEAIRSEQSDTHYPLCGSSELQTFYEVTDVPASCHLLWSSKEEPINCPKGNIQLAFCSFWHLCDKQCSGAREKPIWASLQ